MSFPLSSSGLMLVKCYIYSYQVGIAIAICVIPCLIVGNLIMKLSKQDCLMSVDSVHHCFPFSASGGSYNINNNTED